jgi:hypothetical protein
LSLRCAATAAILSLCASLAYAADIPSDLIPAVKRSASLGRVVFDAENAPSSGSEEFVIGAKGRLTDLCKFEYKPIVATFENQQLVFFIAQPPAPNYMVFGRHFRVEGEQVFPSTNTCIAVPPNPPEKAAVAAFITHLLSDAPTEFHVYLSLKHGKPIYVGTNVGNWIVDGERIDFLQKR